MWSSPDHGGGVVYGATKSGWRASPPYATHVKGRPPVETELSRCGRITYDRAARNLVTVLEPRNPLVLLPQRSGRPGLEFLVRRLATSPALLRSTRYLGQTSFRGVPAYRPRPYATARAWASVVEYLVRRDNYCPLRVVSEHFKGHRRVRHTFSDFDESLVPTKTEHLLHVAPHPRSVSPPGNRHELLPGTGMRRLRDAPAPDRRETG